jgi:hypothetical protein
MSDHPDKIEKVSIIVSRGSLEGVYPGLIMANGARMEGIEATRPERRREQNDLDASDDVEKTLDQILRASGISCGVFVDRIKRPLMKIRFIRFLLPSVTESQTPEPRTAEHKQTDKADSSLLLDSC